MYYTESIRASYAPYIVHDVDVGMGKVGAHCTAENTYFQVSAVTNSHEANFETGWNRNRFRLTETIYMKLRH